MTDRRSQGPAPGGRDGAIQIRDAAAPDLPALLDLIEGAYRGDRARRGWTHEADLLDGQRTDAAALAAILADPDQLILVAEDGGLAGCARLGRVAPGIVQIGMLSVEAGRQAGGIGRRLLAAAEAAAASRFGAALIELEVIRQRRELIDWYVRRGYRATGEERPFPAADPRFGLPRRPDLAFAVLEKRLAG